MRRLPPLNALRAFEAAARRGSFLQAAAELHVTPAAVSHSIKVLEGELGVRLFRRFNRAVELTEKGRAWLPELRSAIDQLAVSIDHVTAPRRGSVLKVSISPSFAPKWLVPRLARLRAKHPEIDVSVIAERRFVDFAHEDVHVGLRYGFGQYPGLHTELLLASDIFPICSPALLTGERPLRTPIDLRWHTLLHERGPVTDESCPDWDRWLRASGVNSIDATRGLSFSDISHCHDAALAGQGVALGKSILAADDLAAGWLVKPFRLSVRVKASLYVVYPPMLHDHPHVRTFCNWLQIEARKTRAVLRRYGCPSS